MKIRGWKSETECQGLHTTGFADVVFQVCTKVTILFYLFHVAYVSSIKTQKIKGIFENN